MSRQKISEYLAKKTLSPAFQLTFTGYHATPKTTASELKTHFGAQNLALKVDQGIKKRGLQGLVKLNLTPNEVPTIIKDWQQFGWSSFLVEPVVEHDKSAERYLALERIRTGWQIMYSPRGGVDIESNWAEVGSKLPTQLEHFIYDSLIPMLDSYHIAFLEMNPVIIREDKLIPLDMAVEVDTAGSPLATLPDRVLTKAEQDVITLDNSTPASLKFRVINPQGSIWMLLSGGGASLVLADEVADVGLGSSLANYGEYSGAPSDDDVYSYTKIILKQMLEPSTFQPGPHALIIAGGVANFTDVVKTFKGLIKALSEQQSALKSSQFKVYVRRGGPNEPQGLKLMHDFLSSVGLLGSVYGHETSLTQVITDVKNYLKK